MVPVKSNRVGDFFVLIFIDCVKFKSMHTNHIDMVG